MRQTILTIEDDAAIRRGIVDSLTYAGFRVIEASNGREGLERALSETYDLLLLDLILPGVSGMEILGEVRRSRAGSPVIILTAKGQEDDRVAGLRGGADDYVIKPFSVRELLARVEAVLRRTPARPLTLARAEFPGGHADFERREVLFENGGSAELSEREAELLAYLVTNASRAVSRDELLSNVWRISPKGLSTRTIDMHVARLREKLNDDSNDPRLIVTVRGKGYKYAAEV